MPLMTHIDQAVVSYITPGISFMNEFTSLLNELLCFFVYNIVYFVYTLYSSGTILVTPKQIALITDIG